MRSRFLLLLVCAPAVFANTAPVSPVFLEPDAELRVVSAADVHLATAPFTDADGDGHRCTDWEIVHDSGLAWESSCASGTEAVHIHLGDGSFVGAHAGRDSLLPGEEYVARARFRDDSGDAASEWSAWSERRFLTATATHMTPLALRRVLREPAPQLLQGGAAVAIPAGARVRLEAPDGMALLEITSAGLSDWNALPASSATRLVLQAGPETWELAESELRLMDASGSTHTIYIPAMTLASGEARYFWISANGGTHLAERADRAPDFTRIARGNPVPWRARRGFVVERVATGLQLPTNITFVPNPSSAPDSPLFYVNELYGEIKVVTRAGDVRTYATGLVDFEPTGNFPGSGELGLADLAIDPETGDVFATTVYWPDRTILEAYAKIVRLHSLDGGLTAASSETILAMPGERQPASHQISNITIGPDRKLYVHMGDGQRVELAQDMTMFRGKILRVNLDGSAPEDNPFFNAADGITATDYIYALGFRNPFGGAWRARDGALYELENGPAVDRITRVVRGRNYLWDGTNQSMFHFALKTYGSGSAPVQLAFIEPETFGGSGFPPSMWDHAFVSLSGATWSSGPQPPGKRISEIVLSTGDTRDENEQTLVEYDGTGKGTVVGLAAGPDGLYFTDLYKDFDYEAPTDRGASVYRIRWAGYADFWPRGRAGTLEVDFLDDSDVPEATAWQWEFGDGSTSSERNPRHAYAAPGEYLVRLSVTGSAGTLTRTKGVRVSVGRGRAVRH